MSDEEQERQYFFGRRTDKVIVSKRFNSNDDGAPMRIASQIVDGEHGIEHVAVKDEVILRTTPRMRYELKATFMETDRNIKVLTIQRFNPDGKPYGKIGFSLVGSEIDLLLRFVAGIGTSSLESPGTTHFTNRELRASILNNQQAKAIFDSNSDLFLELAQNEALSRDLIAVGYRRVQLEIFERLLYDPDFFSAEQERLSFGPEKVWQTFFEKNTWIFGYGLSFQFLSSLDSRKLETVAAGQSLKGAGKRVDAMMKTSGFIGSLCFVEVKHHNTKLLQNTPYRPDAWAPASELVGGVCQVQTTIQSAIETLGTHFYPRMEDGSPTGEQLFAVEPRAYLIIGTLSEFQTSNGINVVKFKSFENYRRHTSKPEILTFDELLYRAKYIVEHQSASVEPT